MAICDLKAATSDIALGILCGGKGTWPSHPGCKAETNQKKNKAETRRLKGSPRHQR